MAANRPITDCQKYFSRERMPSGSLSTTLRQSSTQPMAPKPIVTMITMQTKRLAQSNHSSLDRPIASRISAPPMVGVPRLARWVCIPYSRIGCPTLSSVSLRITKGPNTSPISRAVTAAIVARKVRYWKTRRKPHSGLRPCSHMAKLSSMGTSGQGGDNLFHLHESRTFDQHRAHHRGLVWRGQGGDDVGTTAEMTGRRAIGLRRVGAQLSGRPDVFDAALAGVLPHLGMESRAL